MKGHQFLKPESTNKAILFSMTFSMASKVFNFGQSLVVSYTFGTTTGTDILFYVLSLVILFTGLINQINQQVIVPNAIELRNNCSEDDSRKFLSFIYLIYVGIGLIVTFLLIISPTTLLESVSRFKADDIRSHIDIIRYILPVFLLIIANTYMLDVFTSYRYFTLPMLLDMLKNIVIILFIFLFKDKYSVSSLAIGILAGNLLQFIVLNFLFFIIFKFPITLKIYSISKTIKKNIFYVVVGQATTFLTGFAVLYLMSGFDSGVYSAMDYSQKISTIFVLVFVGQISTVIGVAMIDLFTKGQFEKLNELFLSGFKFSLFFLLPFCVFISFNAQIVISLVFERGNFSKDAVALASGFLKYFILLIPYVLMNSLVVRLIIAKQIQRTAFWWQVSQSIGNILVIYLMIRIFGYYGYPMGSLLASYIYILLLLNYLVKSQFPFIKRLEAIKYFVQVSLISFLTVIPLWVLHLFFNAGETLLTKILYLGLSAMLYALLYGFVGYFTGINRKIMINMLSKIRLRAGRM